MAVATLAAAATGIGVALESSTEAATPPAVGAVPSAVIAALNHGGPAKIQEFTVASAHAAAGLARAAAVTSAVQHSLFPGTASGASLVEVNNGGSSGAHLAWLVSLTPTDPIYPPAPPPGSKAMKTPPHAANVVVVVIDATNGSYLFSSANYIPSL